MQYELEPPWGLVCQISVAINVLVLVSCLLTVGLLVKHRHLIRGVAGFATQMGRLSQAGNGPPLAEQLGQARRRPGRASMRPPPEED